MTANKENMGTVKVKLIRPHEHNRFFLPAGEEITVTPAKAEWLKRHGVVATDDKKEAN